MHKIHLWLTSSYPEYNLDSYSSLISKDHIKADFISGGQEFNTFLNKLRSEDDQLSVAKFLSNRWESESEMEMIDKDYAGSGSYLYHSYRQDKVLHLIVSLDSQSELENYCLLDSLSGQDFEKVVLHIFTTVDQAIPCWQNLKSKLSLKDDNILSQLVIGSVSDIKTISNTDNQYFSLLPRLMYEPTLASENEQYLSIDEYLKIHYGSHYYLSLDYYKPSFWQKLQSTSDISQLLELIINNQSSSEIFPTDNPNHRIELNDEVMFVNYNQPKLLNLYPLMQEIDQVFGLQTYFFAIACDPEFGLDCMFKNHTINANQICINFNCDNLSQYPTWISKALVASHFILDPTFQSHHNQLLIDSFNLTDKIDQDRLKVSLINAQVTTEPYIIIDDKIWISSSNDPSPSQEIYYPQEIIDKTKVNPTLYEDQLWQAIQTFFTDK
jgi:hypothetical protein